MPLTKAAKYIGVASTAEKIGLIIVLVEEEQLS